jgi:AraC family L-rhamnose operon regulatory protein RhaS
MSRLLPTYEDREQRYQADACSALAQAAQMGRVRLEAVVHGHYPGNKLPRSALPGVKTVGFWDAATEQDWGLDWHRNEGIELTLLETGTIDFGVDGSSHRLKPDDLTITRPWQRHRVGAPKVGPGRLHWLILDVGVRHPDEPWRWPGWIVLAKPDLKQLTEYLRHSDQAVWSNAIEVRECFREIANTLTSDRGGDGVSRLTIYVNQLLLAVLEVFRHRAVRLDRSLAGKQHTVELFLKDLKARPELLVRDWTVPAMARACGLGETRFAHYCRLLTNATPLKYLNQLRLDAAADLLRQRPTATVAEVAAECGFTSSRYFATAFQQHFGGTPTAWRRAR